MRNWRWMGKRSPFNTPSIQTQRCAYIWLMLLMHYLPSTCVWIDGYFTGATAMAVHCCRHFFTGEKSLYFLLWGHKLPRLCSLQGITYKLRIPVYFWAWKEVFYPNCKEKQKNPITQWTRKHAHYHVTWTTVHKKFSRDSDVKCDHRKNEPAYFLNRTTCFY